MTETARGTHNGWLTEAVRLTLFPVHGKSVATHSWEEISGGLPTQVNREPALGVSQEVGPFRDGRLALVTQPDRSILLFTPEPLVYSPMTELTHLGEPNVAIERFLVAAKKLLKDEALVKRVGVGLVLAYPVASVLEGLRDVFRGLDINRDASQISDFLLQINAPILSKLLGESYRLNRLAKWQVMQLQLVNMLVSPEGGQIANTFAVPVIRLELDINTPPDYADSFDAAKVENIVDECLAAAQDILAQGGLTI